MMDALAVMTSATAYVEESANRLFDKASYKQTYHELSTFFMKAANDVYGRKVVFASEFFSPLWLLL